MPACAYHGPYAIVNTTLNLNAGSELAQQERKAASFVFTPEFCGFAPSQSGEDQVRRQPHQRSRPARLSSNEGATASRTAGAGHGDGHFRRRGQPQQRLRDVGPMAFLLTVFDARLGWWLGNPRWQEASRRPGPSFALWYLLAELLGQTTARTQVRQPVRRRPLREPGPLRAGAPALPLHHHRRRRAGRRADVRIARRRRFASAAPTSAWRSTSIRPDSDRRTDSARRTAWSAPSSIPRSIRCAGADER